MSTLPNRWTLQELQGDAATAKGVFRHERVGEPLDLYKKFFDTFAAIFLNTIGELPALASDPVDASLVSRLVTGRNQQKAFRYLAAPPISEDDLKALAETTLAPSVLKVDVPAAQRVRDTVLALLDPHRFPWISARRAPTDTGGKAAHWYQQLGRAQVIPCAVLSGVFAPANLVKVQDNGGVYLFWQHRLGDLASFVK
jgi:hypothetical protein